MSDSLNLYNLPGDIYDTIAAFLPNNTDLYRFLTLSRLISVSPYILQQRKWLQATVSVLARDGDLPGVQYLMQEHHLPFLSLLEGQRAMNSAALNGHLAVVQYLHRIGVPCNKTYTMDYAARQGHLAVLQFLHGVGAQCSWLAMNQAAGYGHLSVVEFLHSIDAAHSVDWVIEEFIAYRRGHVGVAQFFQTLLMAKK